MIFALNNMYDVDHSISTSDPLYDQSQLIGSNPEQGAEQINKNDPECDGEKNEYYDSGFGVEHVYSGQIKEGMSDVEMVLSCDQERITISGSVNQVLDGKDIPENDTGFIAYTGSGAVSIDVDTDYNFDGYNDLSSMWNNGSQIQNSYVFLYNPINKQFVYNNQLSQLDNILVNEENKTVIEGECDIETDDVEVCQEAYPVYQWKYGILIKMK